MIFSLMAAAISVALAPTAAQAAPPKSAAKPSTIELGDFDGRLRSVKASINGVDGLFQVDTGGGISLISPDFASKLGCVPWGAHTGFRLTGERLDLPRCDGIAFQLPSGETLRPVSAGVTDVRSLLWEGASPVDGSLALDALEGRQFTLDLGNGVLTMETPASLTARVQGMTEVPMRLVRQVTGHALGVAVPVPTAKGDLWMTLDSGSSAPVLLRDKIAADAGADPRQAKPQPFILIVGGPQRIETATRAIVRDLILDGVIGLPVLVQWSMTFDLKANRLWLKKVR